MYKKWKALASVAVAAALVIAPLTLTGAVADDGAPSAETTAAVVEEVAPAAVAEESAPAPEVVAEVAPAPEVEAPVAQPSYPTPMPSPTYTPPPLVEVTPWLEWTDPTCDAAGALTLFDGEGVVWGAVLNDDDSTTYTASPAEGFVFPVDAQTQWTVPDLAQLPPSSEACYTPPDEPVVALFDVDPQPPTCESAGTFDTSIFPIDRAGYVLTVDRPFDGPGTYTITATAKPGFVIQGSVSREITVLGALGFQSTDPEAPCFLAPPTVVTLSPPMAEDECGTDNDFAVLPSSTEGIVYSWVDEEDPDNLDVVATVQAGFVVNEVPTGWTDNEDGTFTYPWTYVFTDEECPTTPTVVTLSPPTAEDECGTDNDFAVLPSSTEGIVYSWVDEEDPDNLDVVATVQAGFVVNEVPTGWTDNEDGTFTYPWTYEFTDEDCPLVPGDIGSQCVGSVPYLDYAVGLPDGFEADSDNPLTITFVNPTDPSQNYVVSNLPLSGMLLWPGASATEPLQWPGWELLPNGTYVETDGNYAWTRDDVTVQFDVNPTYQTTVSYPPASALCANPASDDPPPLAVTGGSDVRPWAMGGIGVLMVGVALLATRRLARR